VQDRLKTLRDQVATELGVRFGDKRHNRNLTSAECGKVGGEMVRRALAQVWDLDYVTADYAPYVANSVYNQIPTYRDATH